MFQVDALKRLVISMDSKTATVWVCVEFLTGVNNCQRFSFDVCVLCLDVCEGFAGEGNGLVVLYEYSAKAFH